MSLCLSTGTMTTMASSSPRRDRPPRPRSPRANWQKWRGRRPPGGEGGRAGAAGVSAVGRARAHCQHRHARSSRDTAPRGETQSRGAVREGDAGRCSRLSHQHPGNPSPRCASSFSSVLTSGTASYRFNRFVFACLLPAKLSKARIFSLNVLFPRVSCT